VSKDVSVTEAVLLTDIDESAVKSEYAEAVKFAAAAGEGKDKAVAEIKLTVLASLGRAIGITL